jgi:lycopene beta-cyclase
MTMWSQQNRNQRDFQSFGGDFLMEQPVDILRGFFSAFFAIEQDVWSGFLAGWPGLPNNFHHETWDRRIQFALGLFLKMPNPVRIAMILYSIKYTFIYGPNVLLRSLTPSFVFGEGPNDFQWIPPPYAEEIGDFAAKNEARRLIAEFKPWSENDKKDNVIDPLIASVKEDIFPSPFNSS